MKNLLSARHFGAVVKHYKGDDFPVRENIDFVASYSSWSREEKDKYNAHISKSLSHAFQRGNDFEAYCGEIISIQHPESHVEKYYATKKEKILVDPELGVRGIPDFVVEDQYGFIVYECKTLGTYLRYKKQHQCQAMLYGLLIALNEDVGKFVKVRMMYGNQDKVGITDLGYVTEEQIDKQVSYCQRFQEDMRKGNFDIMPVEKYTEPLSCKSEMGILATELAKIKEHTKFLKEEESRLKDQILDLATDKKMIFDNNIKMTISETTDTVQTQDKEFLLKRKQELQEQLKTNEESLAKLENGEPPLTVTTRRGSKSIRVS